MTGPVHNRLVRQIRDKHVTVAAEKYLTGCLLDIGCGEKPLAALVAPYVSHHVGVDHPGTPHDRSRIDVYGTAYALPFADCTFDSAMCNAVLEHLEEPEEGLRECFRALRPGGYAVYTAPFIWHVHEEPRDFYRYSPFGLRHLFSKAGFEIVEVIALSGFWVTFGQLFAYNVARFNRGPIKRLRLLDPLLLLIQGVAYALDKLDKSERWSWAHLVVARKPVDS